MYRGDQNDPTITMGEKTFLAEKNEQDAVRQAQTNNIVKLEVNQPRPPPRPQGMQNINPISFMPSFNTNPFVPPQFNQMGFMNPIVTTFGPEGYGAFNINKIYDIQVGGPAGSHANLNMMFENLLTPKNIVSTFKSLSERLVQYESIRGMLFNKGDGQNTNFKGVGRDSILSTIKFLKLNPYNSYRFSDNPYKGLPDGFLLYSSCYPIRRGNNGNATCSRDSIPVNVRIYKLNKGAFLLNKQNIKKFYEYPAWREVAFYEYIREYILKKKICPHFPFCYGYYLTEKSELDFDKANRLASTPDKTKKSISQIVDNNIRSLEIQQFPYVDPTPQPNFANPLDFIKHLKSLNQQLTQPQPTKPAISPADLDVHNGEVLTIVTEGQTYYFFDWLVDRVANPAISGNIQTQLSSGQKSADVWYSILFQLMVALLTMQYHGIYIDNFNFERNVFIKELGNDGIPTNYWKYRIDGIDYYVPNYGYVVIIDSDYKDLDDLQKLTLSINVPTSSGTHNKLDGKIFGTGASMSGIALPDSGNTLIMTEINDKIFEIFKRIFDDNIFKGDFEQRGYQKPPQKIYDLLNKIKAKSSSTSSTNISDYIVEFMPRYLNNRIGTYLKEQEQVNVRSDATKTFIKGQLVVYLDQNEGVNRFAMYLDSDVNTGISNIYTRDTLPQNPSIDDILSTDIVSKTIQTSDLSIYSKAEPIQQNFKAGDVVLNEENLIETYVIVKPTP
jgi:hypothetical protein